MNTTTYSSSVSASSEALWSDDRHAELSRLISAAVVNKRFRDLLLRNPEEALEAGYQGEAFMLASEERALITSIQATSLADFAMQLVNHQYGECGNRNGKTYGIGTSYWGARQVHQKSR